MKEEHELESISWKGQASSLTQNTYFKIELTRNNQSLIIVSHIHFSIRSTPISLCYIRLARLASMKFRTLRGQSGTRWPWSPIVSKQI